MSKVTNRLAELRQGRDWHRTVVAATCNVSEKTVYRWEIGASKVDPDLIPTLADLFAVSPEYLMGWDRETTTMKAA